MEIQKISHESQVPAELWYLVLNKLYTNKKE